MQQRPGRPVFIVFIFDFQGSWARGRAHVLGPSVHKGDGEWCEGVGRAGRAAEDPKTTRREFLEHKLTPLCYPHACLCNGSLTSRHYTAVSARVSRAWYERNAATGRCRGHATARHVVRRYTKADSTAPFSTLSRSVVRIDA